MTWTLEDIIVKVRNLTGTPSSDQLSDTVIINYINNYYVYTMPFELKEQVQLDFLEFKAFPGQDVYTFPGTFLTDQPMAYADGFPLIFYQDPDVFYQDWPQEYSVDSLATGDGTTITFSGSLQDPPLIAGSLFITDGTQVLQDNGSGTFTGNGTGTISYSSGAYSVNFTTAPAASATIYAKYLGYQADRPQGVLFFNNEFTFRPVPDQVYQIQMQGYINPTPLSNLADLPGFPEWGPLLAYGAAIEIFNDRGDENAVSVAMANLKRYENVAIARTVQQYQAEQSLPRF